MNENRFRSRSVTVAPNFSTLIQWINHEEANNVKEFCGISNIIIALQDAIKTIAELLRTPVPHAARIRANITPENCLNYPRIASNIILTHLRQVDNIYALVYDEDLKPEYIFEQGEFVIFIIALEGHIGHGLFETKGSLFSIYKKLKQPKRSLSVREPRLKRLLQRGRDVFMSGLAIYGISTVFLLGTLSTGVCEFFLDDVLGEFVYVGDVRTPKEGNMFYVEEHNIPDWDQNLAELIVLRKHTLKQYPCRYRFLPSKCAMLYHVVKRGGLYILPAYKMNSNDSVNLIFEAIPMAHLIRLSGGSATTGIYSPLEFLPQTLKDRVRLIAGSSIEMNFAMEYECFRRTINLNNDK